MFKQLSHLARWGGVLASAAVVLTACGGGGGGAEPATTEDGLTKVNVGTIPAILSAPLFVGIEEGIFEKHGLDVQVNFADGGAAVIPSVLSGENQFGYSNTVSQLAAIDQGLPLRLVQPAWAPHSDPNDDDHGVLVLPDSGINEPKDLEGANIAVNTLQNIGEIHIRRVFDNKGLNDETLTWTQLPFSDMGEALERGDVDAIWVSEPHRTPGLNKGWKQIIGPGAESFPDQVSGYYSTSQSFAEANPETVASFRDAMREVNAFAEENPDRVGQVAVAEMGIDAGIIDQVNFPKFPTEDDGQALRDYGAAVVEYGIINEEPADYDALFAVED
ncbi:ABC transporter substrate-binding protein [Mycobacterium sp. NAZ190054]|uniref:ABC transporter substrate-binding protein n=1 Tax=Mycobacterium sp. NAZ190054 TaxID=1747766 RepID=UPI000793781A|nr:ABC transporter substrate-binding protein [Mycobacterium sp. NAZ190054]KWX65916.1 nitrate ABC transporter substrate-binding protein [Mycobacterium sp. NAZ190054]